MSEYSLLLVLIYFLPTGIAIGRKGRDGIIALNLLLGWTLIGWVVALVWALAAEKTGEKGFGLGWLVVVLCGVVFALSIFSPSYDELAQGVDNQNSMEKPAATVKQGGVRILSHKKILGKYGEKIVGEVQNCTDRPVSFIMVTATYYGKNNQVEGANRTFAVDSSPLKSGETAPFEITNPDKVQFDHYKLRVTWQ